MQTPIPTEPRELAAFLERTSPEKWADARQQLLAQLPDRHPAAVEELFEDASDEAMNTVNCRQERAVLRDALRLIKLHADYAQRHLRELRGPLYDVSYAESHAGQCLTEALAELAVKAAEADAINEGIHFDTLPYELRSGATS